MESGEMLGKGERGGTKPLLGGEREGGCRLGKRENSRC